MPQEISPYDTTRAAAFELWMQAPNPMVTFFKTLDVTRLVKLSGQAQKLWNLNFHITMCPHSINTLNR